MSLCMSDKKSAKIKPYFEAESTFICTKPPQEGGFVTHNIWHVPWDIARAAFGMWFDITTHVVDTYHMLNLHSKTRQRLLRYYFTNPTARHHVRDLAHRLDVDPSNLSKELHRLETDGLFASETSGRQKYFRLNRKYPLFAEVRRIVEKTIGTTHLLAESLRRIDGIQEAYLYGSFARNQQDAASDIDVIVIGTPKGSVLAEAAGALERQLGREINYTVLTRKEFDSRRARKDAFIQGIWNNERLALVSPA